MGVLSRYSYVLILVLLVAGTTGAAVWTANVAMGVGALVIAALLACFWVAARRGVPIPANPERRIQRARSAGRPLVVHFFSDYSLSCLVQRLMATPLERRYRGQVDFVYIDVNQAAARSVMEAYQARMGDYLLFDRLGNASGKTRRLSVERLAQLGVKRAK